MKIIICALICCLWSFEICATAANDDSSPIYDSIKSSLTPSQLRLCEYLDSLLNTGADKKHLQLAHVKAKEIVKDEISAYLSDNGYGDLKHFYREAMAGRAQENMNHLCNIESFIKRETDSAEEACDFFLRCERLSFCDYLHASTLSCFYIAWTLYNDCDSAISFSELLSPYSSFQDALEGIAAEKEKTPEEVEAELRSRFPLAFERQE